MLLSGGYNTSGHFDLPTYLWQLVRLCLQASHIIKTNTSRSIPNQLKSVWNSYTAFVVQWVLNWSTDLVAFLYPFFLLKHISLRKEQKLALIGVFSLGAITLSVSLARFVAYNATDFELEDESGSMSIQSTTHYLRGLTESQISCLLPKWLQAL